jgi:hypothetical protein
VTRCLQDLSFSRFPVHPDRFPPQPATTSESSMRLQHHLVLNNRLFIFLIQTPIISILASNRILVRGAACNKRRGHYYSRLKKKKKWCVELLDTVFLLTGIVRGTAPSAHNMATRALLIVHEAGSEPDKRTLAGYSKLNWWQETYCVL